MNYLSDICESISSDHWSINVDYVQKDKSNTSVVFLTIPQFIFLDIKIHKSIHIVNKSHECIITSKDNEYVHRSMELPKDRKI